MSTHFTIGRALLVSFAVTGTLAILLVISLISAFSATTARSVRIDAGCIIFTGGNEDTLREIGCQIQDCPSGLKVLEWRLHFSENGESISIGDVVSAIKNDTIDDSAINRHVKYLGPSESGMLVCNMGQFCIRIKNGKAVSFSAQSTHIEPGARTGIQVNKETIIWLPVSVAQISDFGVSVDGVYEQFGK